MTIYSAADPSLIPADEIDWSDFDPGWVEHVKTRMLAGPLASGAVPARLLAACQETYGSENVSRSKSGHKLVDLSPIAEARARSDAAADLAADALRNYRETIRDCYRAGATARAIASAAGLSVPRVNQIVAGARLEG